MCGFGGCFFGGKGGHGSTVVKNKRAAYPWTSIKGFSSAVTLCSPFYPSKYLRRFVSDDVGNWLLQMVITLHEHKCASGKLVITGLIDRS